MKLGESLANDVCRRPYGNGMVGAPARREIERVPALLVGFLDAAGDLPRLPPSVEAMVQFGIRRDATLAESSALSWLIAWKGARRPGALYRQVSGVAAYRDCFDYPSGTDVREIVHIAGSRRATVDLLRWMVGDARAQERRAIGSIDKRNRAMGDVLFRMGHRTTRIVWEDAQSGNVR